MKKLVLALALVALPSMSFAAGIDMTWDQCIGGAPTQSKVFNCAANANYNVHFQFKLSSPLASFVSATAFVDYQNSTGTPLTPFWRYEGGGCQLAPTTKGMIIDDNNLLAHESCATTENGGDKEDVWGGNGSGGTESLNAYGVDFRRPGNGYLVLLDYRTNGDGVPVLAGPNYWLFRINMRTFNRGACAGCADPGILLFQRLSLESSGAPPEPTVNLDNADKLGTCLTINNGSAGLCPVVPVKNTSWGQLKTLYR